MSLVKIFVYIIACYFFITSSGVGAVEKKKGSGRLLCWTNNEGVRECGDRIPPEYSQQEHQEFNKRGMVIDESEAAKTEEELAKVEEEAAAAAEEARLAKEAALRDKILLDTFTSVEDIESARDSKLQTLDSTISLAEKRETKMQEELDRQVNQAAAAEREGKAPPEHLLKDIESLERQIGTNNELIAGTRKEQEEVKAKYDSDIARFKELKAIP